MRKLILLVLAVLAIVAMLSACKMDESPKPPHDGFGTLEHEGCEYVLYFSGGVCRGLTHAGNCSNHKTETKPMLYR